jgi:hypothetical protein
LEELVAGICIPDSVKSIILMALVDIVMIDNHIDEVEKNVSVRIAVLLGIDRDVALMEINRYEQQQTPGHRHKDVDPCAVSLRGSPPLSISPGATRGVFRLSTIREQILDISEEILENSEAAMTKRKKLMQKQGLRDASSKIDQKYGKSGEHDEAILLRREVFRLKRKVDKLTRMLHDARQRPQLVARGSSTGSSKGVVPSPPSKIGI